MVIARSRRRRGNLAAFVILGVVTWEQGRALARLERENVMLRGHITYLTTCQGWLKKEAVACLTNLDQWIEEERQLRRKR